VQFLDGFLAVSRIGNLIALRDQSRAQNPADLRIVINN